VGSLSVRDERLVAGSLDAESVFTDLLFADSDFGDPLFAGSGFGFSGFSLVVCTCTLPQLELRRRAVFGSRSVRVGASDGSAVVAAGVVS
jgi:hypothetical protein